MATATPFYNPLDQQAALQAADIQRRQKLAEALQQGGQQQEGTQMVGNIAVPVSPLAAMAKALQTTAGGYFEGKAQRDALKLQGQQYAALLNGVSNGGLSPQGTDTANSMAGSIPGTSSGTGVVPGAGLNPQVAAMAIALGGPEALGTLYRENYLAHNNPTDMMKNDAWQGIAPNQQRALTMSEAAKNVGVSGGQPNFDQSGNMSITPIPGAADTQAGFTDAQEGVKAKYGNPVPVTGPDGSTQLVRPDILANQLQPGVAAPGGVSPQNPDMNISPPQTGGLAQGVQVPQVSPQQLGIPVQSAGAADQNKSLNTDFIDKGYRPAIDAGDAAEMLNAQYDTLRANPEINSTSWTAPMQQKGAEILNGFGIAPEAAQKMATNAETFNSGLKGLVIPKMRAQLGPGQRINKNEVEITEKTLGSLKDTPEANKFLLNVGTALNNMQIKKRDFYVQNIGKPKYVNNARQLETDWNNSRPSILDDPAVSSYMKAGPQQPSGPPGGTLIGTSDGKKVFALPDGSHVMEQ